MKCLPLYGYKVLYQPGNSIYWYNYKTHGQESFNDQPYEVWVDDGTLFWGLERLSNKKPHRINRLDGIITDMQWCSWSSRIKTLEDVHPDYQDEWLRLQKE